MQFTFKKTQRNLAIVSALTLLLVAPGCSPTTIDPVPDPNFPGLDSVVSNATLTQIKALGTGVEASLRLGHTNNAPFYQITGTLGREIIVLASNESRWYTEILGTKASGLDNNAFYSAGSYNAFARTIRAANVFRQSAKGASTAVVSTSQLQGILGFSDTYEALAKLYLLDLMGENGIRVDVADYLHPGKFTAGSAPALISIRQLLDQGATELAAGGSSFVFPLSSGYAGFDTPATFLKFNRALAARVSLYQGDYAGALTALATSFYDPAGSLAVGPKVTFNPSIANDQGNAYYQVLDTGPSTLVTVPDNFVNEAEPGDLRLKKVSKRAAPRVLGGIDGNFEPAVYKSQTAPLDIIRNEELVLIAAEAKAKTSNITGAVADIDAIRVGSGGLARYAGAVSQDALVDEVLRQRRYSLFYEGQFWVDLRRLKKLNPAPTPNITLPYSTAPFVLFDRLKVPFAENAWDTANP